MGLKFIKLKIAINFFASFSKKTYYVVLIFSLFHYFLHVQLYLYMPLFKKKSMIKDTQKSVKLIDKILMIDNKLICIK